jgi:DNA-binding response OmpR family regulator
MKRILVAEDDRVNREVVVQYLQLEGYETVEARDGVAALRHARGAIDLAILDIGLPAIDGLNIIRSIRGDRNALPIMVISARVDEVDRIVAFEAGADDYVPKPFMPREVVYRVRALLRRTQRDDSAARLRQVGPFEIDEAARELRIDGEPVELRPREFDLIAALATNPGVAMARRTLIERAWGADFNGDERTVDGHIRRIRQKLEAFPQALSLITTIYGFGYKFSGS